LGVVDFFSGFELSFAVFYLIPVAMTAWFVQKNVALITSFISALTWQFSNYLAGELHSNLFIPIWNTSTRLVFFLVVTILIFKLKKSLAHETLLARTDFLTGAANPRAFYEIAQMEINRSRRYKRKFTLVYLDVDNFKSINDTLGHHIGSDLLVKIVHIIKQNLRVTDVIVRLGGDEFAIMLPETDSAQSRSVVTKLRDKLQAEMNSEHWAVTFSIGVLTYSSPPKTIDEVIKFADQLMYEVKRNGKNSIKFKEHGNSSENQLIYV
jgi:diguanylate cyclase (GGDEF)-like protein